MYEKLILQVYSYIVQSFIMGYYSPKTIYLDCIDIIFIYQLMTEEISTEQSDANYQREFKIYLKNQIEWLQWHYKETKVPKYEQKLAQVVNLLYSLKDKLKNENQGKYFRDFARLQRNKHVRIQAVLIRTKEKIPNYKIQETEDYSMTKNQHFQGKHYKDQHEKNQTSSAALSSQTALQNNEQKLILQNHLTIIKLLTRKRFSFKNIARHVYRGRLKNVDERFGKQGFAFDVERGYDHHEWNQVDNVGLFYLYARDLANSIVELQELKIFHRDLHDRNIILCFKKKMDTKDIKQLLANPQKLASIIDVITFKVIDFGNALLLDDQFIEMTKKILQTKNLMLGSIVLQGQQILQQQLNEIARNGAESANYKKRNSERLVSCCQQMLKNIKFPQRHKQLLQFEPNGKYYKMIMESRNFQGLAKQMDGFIKKFVKDNQNKEQQNK